MNDRWAGRKEKSNEITDAVRYGGVEGEITGDLGRQKQFLQTAIGKEERLMGIRDK